jgi:hypothetical protein
VRASGVADFFRGTLHSQFPFEVQPGNPAVFAASALALVLIGLRAAMLPARSRSIRCVHYGPSG